jgi:hypothetical protein
MRLNIPNVDEVDLKKVLNSASDIIYSDRARAQQMIQTRQFRAWIVSPVSAKLLVHGDFDNPSKLSAFSILAATVSQGFKASPGIISLVFFCGQHLWNDEFHGGNFMIRSLTAQLVQQFPFPSIHPPSDMSAHHIETTTVPQICRLFVYLISQLPPNITVFCIIDGINEYEREEYIHGVDDVIYELMGVVDKGSRAKFKLLLLSPRPTTLVRSPFDEQPGTLLHMQQEPVIEDAVGPGMVREMIEM